MTRWVEYVRKRAGDDFIWDGDFHFGDWLAYTAPSREAPQLPGRDHEQGPDRHRLLRALDRPAAADRARARAGGRRGPLRRAAREDQGRVPGRVRERPRPRRRRTADRLRARAPVRPAARGAAAGGGEAARRGDPRAQAPDHRLPRHAVPLPRAEPLRLSRRGVPAAEPRGVPVVALPGEAGRHHDLGALGRPEAGRQLPGRVDELLQPLRLRRDRRVDVPRDGGHRDRRGGARLQAHPDPAAARRRPHEREGQPRDALRKVGVGVDARRRALRARWSRCLPTRGPRCGCRRRSSEA